MIKLGPLKIGMLLAASLLATDLLILLLQVYDIWPLKILVGVSISFLPGLALLRLVKAKFENTIELLLYSLGFSLLVIMVSGLVVNQVLYFFGFARPLSLAGLLGAFNIATLTMIVLGAIRSREVIRIKRNWRPEISKPALLLIVMSCLIPVLAAAGAFRLNNGGDALFAMIALCWIGLTLACTFLFRKRVGDWSLAWCVFMAGLGILLMTSLRGWDITGHDIMREFRVYSLTHMYAHWNIAAYRDPYNACLSITILPETFAKFLNISGLVVFKLILQIFFAATVAVIYVMLRRFVSKLGALVGCAVFICYPTFINDSAMLTRQGVAYLFFALALLAALRPRRQKVDVLLFALSGLGVVLSHYSTSYMFVALFAIALACKLAIEKWRGWKWHIHADKSTVLTPTMLIALVAATFLWYSFFTATARGLAITVSNSVANVPHLFSADNKSSDTSASLVMATHKTQADVYQEYIQSSNPEDMQANSFKYMPNLISDDIPITRLGKFLSLHGADPTVTAELRQNFAKVLQVIAAISVIYATYLSVFYTTYLYARKKQSTLSLDLMCLSIAGIVLLIAMVVLPTFSVNYGVLRAFQQSLVFLVVPLMVALTMMFRWLKPKFRAGVALTGVLLLFVLFTGVAAQALGGVSAPLTLNNRGLYYGLYYTTKADLQAYGWIKQNIPRTQDVRAASFSKAVMHDPNYPFSKVGILPMLKPKGSFVYLDQAQTVAQKFYVYHEGDPLITTFPLQYYADQTNQLYSTLSTGVYQ